MYVDRLVYGYGRCCAEKAGLVVHRYRLPAGTQTGPNLLDHLPEEPDVEPYPQIRIDVAGVSADTAHTTIVTHARSMICASDGTSPGSVPAEVIDAANDQWSGMAAILERHSPIMAVRVATGEPDGALCRYCTRQGWPCPDYRDACRGLATGLPA